MDSFNSGENQGNVDQDRWGRYTKDYKQSLYDIFKDYKFKEI